jgi:nucleoside-diphosphate-sugar epimerase
MDPSRITDSSSSLPFQQILGVYSPPVVGVTVHLDDLLKAHVLSLDPKVPGNTNYLLSSGGIVRIIWTDAIDIVAKSFPRAVAAGTLPNNGKMETQKLPIYITEAEKALGMKFLGYGKQIKSVTSHYLEFVGAEES